MLQTRRPALSGNALKGIAILAMTLDHLTWTLWPGYSTAWWVLLLHVLGRVTAPIMWFFIVEGYHYTHDVKKYAARLFALAVVSHFAYDFCFGIPFLPLSTGPFNQTGVVWSLAWGLMLLVIHDDARLKGWVKLVLTFLICVITFPSDWSCIAAVAILYMGQARGDFRRQMCWLMVWSAVYALVYFFFIDKIYALVQLSTCLAIPLHGQALLRLLSRAPRAHRRAARAALGRGRKHGRRQLLSKLYKASARAEENFVRAFSCTRVHFRAPCDKMHPYFNPKEASPVRYQCLVLDHDDTVVNSTASVNYPAFVQTLRTLRPDVHMTLDDFFSYSFEPGFGALCSDILHFSDSEMDFQYRTWLERARTHVPDTFPGMRELLQRYHAAGGHICVVSHSVPETILRDYRAHDLPTPELIYGWDDDPERRKPAPWPIYQIEHALGLRPEQLVVIDDLKPGKDMADRAGVDFIAAGWTHTVPHIIETMQRISPHYCRTVAELTALLLDETEA